MYNQTMIPWYVQFSISTGLGLLTTYIQRSKLSPDRKQAFSTLMIQVNEFLVEIENPPVA